MRSLPRPAHRLQLLPQPALPQCRVSLRGTLDGGRAQRTAPGEYFHVVFTLPARFNALALSNKRVVYNVLFERASRQTLLELPPIRASAARSLLAILHTWGQNLAQHLHVSLRGARWRTAPRWQMDRLAAGFFLPVGCLSRVFRGKFIVCSSGRSDSGKLRSPGRQRLRRT